MKKAIVIGATSGIGKGIAKLLADNNYMVGITGRRTLLLDEIKNEKPDSYYTSAFDVTDVERIPAYLNELTLELGGLDLLILSSGTGERIKTLDFEIDKRIIDTNVAGFTSIINWGFNYFQQQGHGHLVAISSIAGLRGNRYAPSYSATKAYQINYLEGLRYKAGKMNLPLTITDIRPGFVDTAMGRGDKVFWVSTVEKASGQIFKAIIAKKEIVYITTRWRIIAWMMKFMPSWIYRKI